VGGGDQDWEADAERGAHLGPSGEESSLGLLQTHVAMAKTRNRAGASAGKDIGGDGRAGEAASVRLPEQEILAGKPPQAALGVVEAEGAGALAHALGRAAELGRERVEVAAVEPSPAQGIASSSAL
jgi:hypothetical protein